MQAIVATIDPESDKDFARRRKRARGDEIESAWIGGGTNTIDLSGFGTDAASFEDGKITAVGADKDVEDPFDAVELEQGPGQGAGGHVRAAAFLEPGIPGRQDPQEHRRPLGARGGEQRVAEERAGLLVGVRHQPVADQPRASGRPGAGAIDRESARRARGVGDGGRG